MSIKTVILEPDNHEYLTRLKFINKTSIQFETNQIISNKRESEEELNNG